ncbi:YqjF family protein [Georgenia faecalis]|uniref:YqjF family protein n=1 Tax=Georgenia faecalis TaxID=2483799 RepID=UPI0019D0AAE0|nr:DUF2071 domain-containing protein [Georgenia faecalis]
MSTEVAPHRVGVPVNLHVWEDLTFLHWSYPADVVQALLPPGLTVQAYEGRAWVGVTPFRMRDVRVPGLPAVPHLSTFPEVNVRTYTRTPDGTAGIWFFSLECPRLPFIAALRALGLPYRWADIAMATDRPGSRVAYRSARRPLGGRGDTGVGLRAQVEVGPRITAPGELAVALTARWWAFSRRADRLWRVPAEHEPWPLHEATARVDADSLLRACGLPAPTGRPMVHFSPGVHVRLGPPRPAG